MESELLLNVIGLLGLLGVSTLVYHVCKKIQIPFAVGLLFSGLVLSFLAQYEGYGFAEYVEFSPEMVFYIFLPSLIFESSYHMNLQNLKETMLEIISLSSFGLVLSIVIIGYLLHVILGIPLGVSFLFGSLISATDPVAVLAIFKEVRVPRRLSTILDGESLVNDATALMMFQVFLGGIFATGAYNYFSVGSVAFKGLVLLQVVIVSLMVGGFLGIIFSYAIAKADSHKVQITLSLILAHSTFIFSEKVFSASGILATLVAGIVVGNFGKSKLPLKTQHSLSEIWDFLGFLANALIFLLLGLRLGQVDFQSHWYMVMVAAVITILVARPLAVFGSFGITNWFHAKENKINKKSQVIIAWGGMRGALAAAAVLLVPQSYAFAPVLQAMTGGVILITFLFNALTMKPMLRRLGFGGYTPNETIQRIESQMLVNERILGYLKYMLEAQYITKKLHTTMVQKYKENLVCLSQELKKLKSKYKNHKRETEKILSQYALGIELRTYQKLFEYQEISEDRFRTLRGSIYRQIERLESDELPNETQKTSRIAPRVPDENPGGIWGWLIDHLFEDYRQYKILHRWQHYRARRIASWKVIRDFRVLYKEHEEFKNSPVVKKIIERYESWHANSESKIRQLEKKYPDFVAQVQENFVERMCLKKEIDFERELFEKGLINRKVYQDIAKEIKFKSDLCRKGGGLKMF
ncbi:MAG TPA: sodium:proton antiporter [Candidatus Gracilibacteria bacterium]